MIKAILKFFRGTESRTRTSEEEFQRRPVNPMSENTRIGNRAGVVQPELSTAPAADVWVFAPVPKTVEEAKMALDRAEADLLEAKLRRAYGYEG